MDRPKLLWLDMTITTRHSDVDVRFLDYFDIRYGSAPDRLDCELDIRPGETLVFEFDYPDRPSLSVLRNSKRRYPRTPILMITTQHSEQLAVWAYRNRVFDYLVAPVSQSDLIRCNQLLQSIRNTDGRQHSRPMIDFETRIPVEVPVGQRNSTVRLSAALHFVQRNYPRKICIAEVAGLCNMSLYHFSHVFKETYSLTFQEFVLRFRVLEACRELRHPNIPVANVAFATGFNDPSYFARVFRRYIGVSPSEYCEEINETGFEERMQEVIGELELPMLQAARENIQPASQSRADTDIDLFNSAFEI